jgi:hypothetical protein
MVCAKDQALCYIFRKVVAILINDSGPSYTKFAAAEIRQFSAFFGDLV